MDTFRGLNYLIYTCFDRGCGDGAALQALAQGSSYSALSIYWHSWSGDRDNHIFFRKEGWRWRLTRALVPILDCPTVNLSALPNLAKAYFLASGTEI